MLLFKIIKASTLIVPLTLTKVIRRIVQLPIKNSVEYFL